LYHLKNISITQKHQTHPQYISQAIYLFFITGTEQTAESFLIEHRFMIGGLLANSVC
jgi:hypothetical protein